MTDELIDKQYFASLICAEVIQLDDGSYGLIQPIISFEELHKVIGTSYADGSDRSPLTEALYGPSYYPTLTKQGPHYGLSMALMCSLLLGAHSVHSGNIVVLNNSNPDACKQYARIDWGDAFRNYAHEGNNDALLHPYETAGVFNIKKLTKNYFLNYKNIKGLYPAMTEKAQKLSARLGDKTLLEIVTCVLEKIPKDLIDQNAKDEFSKYAYMESFKTVTFGESKKEDNFAIEMAEILKARLEKITKLQDLTANAADLYQSIISFEPPVNIVSITIESSLTFPQIIEQWKTDIHEKLDNNSIRTESLNLSELAQRFNNYVNTLAEFSETNNIWGHDFSSTPGNLFISYHTSNDVEEAINGHAFVPYYKESTILRNLVSLDPKTLSTARFYVYDKPSDDYAKDLDHENSAWVKMRALATAGQAIINTLKVLKQAQSFAMEEFVVETLATLISNFNTFQQAEQDVKNLWDTYPLVECHEDNKESAYFYPMSDEDLEEMSGDQLTTICLEELYSRHSAVNF